MMDNAQEKQAYINEGGVKDLIPIICPFDNNYVIGAGVAFYSMLKNFNKNYNYKFYVLSSDITQENKELLKQTVELFSNGLLEFIDMNNKFENLFKKTRSKLHFSKEMYYKLILPSLFLQYDKVFVTDVDAIFLNDITKIYEDFDIESDDYICAPAIDAHEEKIEDLINNDTFRNLYSKFSAEEKKQIKIAVGMLICNLKKMREDDIEKKLLDYVYKNAYRIVCPEQDTYNFVCYNHIKLMPDNAMTSVRCLKYHEQLKMNEKVKKSFENIIQLHYASPNKPWRTGCYKNEIWIEYLAKTPFFEAALGNILNTKY